MNATTTKCRQIIVNFVLNKGDSAGFPKQIQLVEALLNYYAPTTLKMNTRHTALFILAMIRKCFPLARCEMFEFHMLIFPVGGYAVFHIDFFQEVTF
jgi:hypothetical protein